MDRFWQKIVHSDRGEKNIAILGGAAVLIAIGLTVLNIWIYQTDGTLQLDLSRPGYEPDIVLPEEDVRTWSATGELDNAAIDEFLMIWDEEVGRLQGDFFRLAPLSNESLGIRGDDEADEDGGYDYE
jgi:hypothetical protein